VLESFGTSRRDHKAALKFLRKSTKRFGYPHVIVTDKLQSYCAAMAITGDTQKPETGQWLNDRGKNSPLSILLFTTTLTSSGAASARYKEHAPLDPSSECNTHSPWGLGCCDGQTIQTPQWSTFF